MGGREPALLALTGVAGGGLAVQARINGELAVRLGSPLSAGATNFVVGLAVVTAAVAVRRISIRGIARPSGGRWWYWTGGLCAVVFVYAVVVAAPRVGVSITSIGIAAGMAAAGLFADAAGLGPAGRHSLVPRRLAGAGLAVVAVAVASSDALGDLGEWRYVALAVLGGFAVGCQQPINSRLSDVVRDSGLAAVVSFAIGSTTMLVLASTDRPAHGWPTEPVLYFGGVLAAGYVLWAIPTVARIGALQLGLATMCGQLIGAAVLDAVVPIGDKGLTIGKVAGVGVAAVAVWLAAVCGILKSNEVRVRRGSPIGDRTAPAPRHRQAR